MKKLLTLTVLLGAATLSFGQGTVNFANVSTTRVSTNAVSNGAATGLTSSSTVHQYYYALFVAPSSQNTADPSLAGWTYSGNLGTNTTLVGRLNGNYNTDSSVSVPGFAASATADFVVLGWDSNLGTDVNAVRAFWANGAGSGQLPSGFTGGNTTYIGLSGVANDVLMGQLGGSPAPGSLFGTGPGLIPGWTLNQYATAVPEPASFALMGLGGAAMLIFRRRK